MKNSKRLAALLVVSLLAMALAGCGAAQPKELVLGFVPSSDAKNIPETVKPMADFLSKELGIPVKDFVGANYVAVVEGMGSGKVDIGFLATFSYVLANQENGAQIVLTTVRSGAKSYKSQFVVRADSGISKIEDLKGKKMAFVDPASTSGYLFPAAFLKKKGFDPDTFFSKTVFAGGHDKSLVALYNKEVDVAVSFDDARDRLKKDYPDVMEKLKILTYTDEIPNDTVSVRKDMPADLVAKVKAALLKFAGTEEGKKSLNALYRIDGFADGNDADYNVVRDTARSMDIDLKTGKPKAKS